MTKLTYINKTALLAAHIAGQKFEIVNPTGRFPVVAMKSVPHTRLIAVKTEKGVEYSHIRPDGTFDNPHLDNISLQLAKVAPAAGRHRDQVNFATVDAARGAIGSGMKFKAFTHQGYGYRTVREVEVTGTVGNPLLTATFADGGSASYNLDGSHNTFATWHLIVDVTGSLQAKLCKPSDIVRTIQPATPALAPAPVVTQSLIEAFFAGKTIHTPHTREVVIGLSYHRDGRKLTVKLRNEAGKERETPRYRTDGTHLFQPVRNLIVGPLPAKTVTKTINVDIYRHAFNGSLFVIREGEVIPNIRGISNATKVGSTVITETFPA